MSEMIIERGRGPELEGTRITMYCIMDYLRGGFNPEQIASALNLTIGQIDASIAYIDAHKAELSPEYEKIIARVNQKNPAWVDAGRARTWEELMQRFIARRTSDIGDVNSRR